MPFDVIPAGFPLLIPISHAILDAYIDTETVADQLPAQVLADGQRVAVVIFHVQLGAKALIACIVKGQVGGPENTDVTFPPMSKLAVDAGVRYMAGDGKIIFRHLPGANMSDADVEGRVLHTLYFANRGDLVVFIDDFTPATEQRLLRALRVQPQGIRLTFFPR